MELKLRCVYCGGDLEAQVGDYGVVQVEPCICQAKELLSDAAICIGKAEAEGVYQNCVCPLIGERTLARIESFLLK